MESGSLANLSLELIAHILSYLDHVDVDNACHATRLFYRSRPFVVTPRIQPETEFARDYQACPRIPRERIVSNNAFLRLVTRTFTAKRPSAPELELLISLFAQELKSAWVYPVEPGGKEVDVNDRSEDMRIYRRRYSHLRRLARILRWNWAGREIATRMDAWFNEKWQEIKDEERIQQWLYPNYDAPPRTVCLDPHQAQILRGIEYIALMPINLNVPQGVEAEDLESTLNARAWRTPEFERLKFWLSIPELWGLEIRHEELKVFLRPLPFRMYFQIAHRPFLTVVLYLSSEFLWFTLEIFRYLRHVELSAPCPGLRDSRYWYEEDFVWSVLQHGFVNLSIPGQYLVVFKKLFVCLIRGYIELFGPHHISDLMHNIVYFVQDKQLPVRTIIARVVMSELLGFGYDYLTLQAKDAIVRLITDEHGRLLTSDRNRPQPMKDLAPRKLSVGR